MQNHLLDARFAFHGSHISNQNISLRLSPKRLRFVSFRFSCLKLAQHYKALCLAQCNKKCLLFTGGSISLVAFPFPICFLLLNPALWYSGAGVQTMDCNSMWWEFGFFTPRDGAGSTRITCAQTQSPAHTLLLFFTITWIYYTSLFCPPSLSSGYFIRLSSWSHYVRNPVDSHTHARMPTSPCFLAHADSSATARYSVSGFICTR